MSDTDNLLKERGATYGNFADGIQLEAEILNAINARHKKHHGHDIDAMNALFLSKIAMKLSRLSITPDHVDSWRDIAGYARLVELHYTQGNTNA
jgi:hypothetical protein